MQVSTNSASTAQTQSQSTSTETGASMDYDSFLKLLMAEMKNQDPTAPTDASQYVAQFATFSQVEQAMQTNAKLDSMLSSIALSQADGIIGRTLTSEDGTITGEVKAVRIVNNGAVAELDNGKSIILGPGVVIT
ncbi:flagellar hook assembly protein FlgD [Flaviflagellibacter deserti]|jgi:flagellar basal-body rod modification protein FlgD|uniref:Basal-body rod modification protein FlgD n=1 Tax=Flaviflagellibacter deserti TaxID=2267266 RepID=A0ABV9Z763_9HYPH